MILTRHAIRKSWLIPIILMCFLVSYSPRVARAQQSVGGVQESSGALSGSGVLATLLKRVGFDQQLGAQIPLNDTFKDENGQTVVLHSYFGNKPVVLILAYYRCPILCSEVLSGAASAFSQLNFRLGNQYTALTVSIDPTDTPEIAARIKQTYIRQYGDRDGAAGWHFLTGQKVQIDELTNAVGFRYAYDPRNSQYVHAAGIIVTTPSGKVGQYFYGLHFPSRDLRLALVQSSQEKIGSVIDQILLFCCTYDPGTGRYQATITRAIKTAATATILLIAGGLFFLYRRNIKGKDPQTL